MITINEDEFYHSVNNLKNKENTPIDGYTTKNNIYCNNCKYFKSNECIHPENNSYSYTHKGKIKSKIWSPDLKNKLRDCELYEELTKSSLSININLGIKY